MAFTATQIRVRLADPQLDQGGGGDLGGQRWRAVEVDASPVTHQVQLAHGGRPHVARAALLGARCAARWPADGDHRRHRPRGATVAVVSTVPSARVSSVPCDQPGHQVDARAGRRRTSSGAGAGDLGQRPLLHDPAGLDHHQPVGDHRRVERIVGDQDARAGELAQVGGAGSWRHPTARVVTSRADSGSSSSRNCGSVASARATATRCRPDRPTAARGRSPGVSVGQPHPVQPVPARPASGPAPWPRPGCATRRPRWPARSGARTAGDPGRPWQPGRCSGGTSTPLRAGSVERSAPSMRMPKLPRSSGLEAGDRAQEGGLAGPVGPEHGHHLAVGHRQVELQAQGAQVDADRGVDAHADGLAPSQRPRSDTSTTTEMASRARLRAMATWGRPSSSR